MTVPTEGLQFTADFSDQTGIFDPAKVSDTVTVIGCGGIGASILPTLLTMGFKKFILFDPDTVEARNITTNLIFRPRDLFRVKVERVREYLLEYGAESVETHQELYTGQVPLSGLVISGVDTMSARKEIWGHIVDNGDVPLYLDGRIGGEQFTLLAVEPFNSDHIEWYEEFCLFDDSEAAALPCTARTVVYPAVALGAFMAAYLAAWSRGEKVPSRTDLNFHGTPFFQTVAVKASVN
jgi:hypothetical protein